MDSKRIQKTAVSLVLLSFFVLCILRPELRSFVGENDGQEHSKTSLSTVTTTPHVTLMTEENNPTLFRDTFCDFQDEEEWYPTDNNENDWQLRTPYFILGGAKKCATTSLSRYLGQHSRLQLARRKELLFFLPKNFHFISNTTGKTLVKDTREQMYTRDYNATLMKMNTSLYSFEATPGYIFQSTRSPKFMLCAAPWVKLVFILRNPVDRVWSNYNFYLTHGINLPSFETWVQRDLNLLQKVGMLPDNAHSNDFVESDEEYMAWDLYLKRCNEGPVGRSMYIVQLLHWYKALRAIGRDPSTQILIVRNEDLKRDPQATLDRITKWLGVVDSQEPLQPERTKEFMVSKYNVGELSNETKHMLQEFYRPYNQRLYDLLGRDEWQDVWEQPVNTTTAASAYPYSNTSKIYVRDHKNRKHNKKNRKRNKQQLRNSAGGNESQQSTTIDVVQDTLVYGKPSYNATAAADFVSRWCEVEGVDEWYPTTRNQDAWQLRAPHLLIPGAKKSGTTSLAYYLMQHDKVARARTKELQFFMNKNFRANYVRDSDRKTLVKEARLEYEHEFKKTQLQSDPSLISMDATPGYLFFSSMLPQRILCVCPWVKLLIILRNPVDRAYSNYQYVVWRSGGKFKQSFEKFIQNDIDALVQAGVLLEDGDETSLSIEQEDEAWNTYLGLASEGPIGRSLYVIQLRQWFQAIRDVGRDPDSQVHLVRTEDIQKDLDEEYRKVQDFLGLEYEPIKSREAKVVNKYEPMKNETRVMLEKLFAPYNKRLYDMLGGDWQGYWDP